MPAPAHIPHDSDSERPTKLTSRKHSIYIHFSADRNWEVCLRTKMTRAPSRRRTGEAVRAAEKFGDLITADHKVVYEGRQSRKKSPVCSRGTRSCHTMDSIFPVQNKNFSGNQKELTKFLEPSEKPKVIYTDNSLQFGKSCEDLSWNHCTSTPHRSETNGIAERAVRHRTSTPHRSEINNIAERSVRKVKEGTFAVLLQSDCMELFAKCPRPLGWENPYERRFGEPIKSPVIPFGAMVEYYQISARDKSRLHPFEKKVLPGIFIGCVLYAEGIWKGDIFVANIEELEKIDASEIYRRRINAKDILTPRTGILFSQLQTVQQNCWEQTMNSENPLQDRNNLKRVKISVNNFKANRKVFNRQNQETTLKSGKTFGQFKVVSFIVITMNIEFNSCAERKTFPVPLEYIDVTRSTHTNLDVARKSYR